MFGASATSSVSAAWPTPLAKATMPICASTVPSRPKTPPGLASEAIGYSNVRWAGTKASMS